MKNLSTWLLVMFMTMFWILRVVIALNYELGGNFGGIEPFNSTIEIMLIFVVLFCIILIVKRKVVGALIYLLAYGMYFGTSVITGITAMIETNGQVDLLNNSGLYFNTLISFIGILLPVLILFDLIWDKSRKENREDKNTDWFFKNEQYDRKLDDRADKNNYRTF